MARMVLVGAMPPPVHGMASVNAAILAHFRSKGVDLSVIDVSSATLYRTLIMRLGRLPKVAAGLAKFLFYPGYRGDTLYMSVSGGLGQLYELCFLLVARSRGMRVYLHYHSFAYLDRHKWITDLLIRTGGPLCSHITLSPEMAERLRARYPAARQVRSISNAVFFADSRLPPYPTVERSRLRTIGFLGNISADKGIFDFLDLVAACEAQGLPLRASIAGPFQDEETERKVRERLRQIAAADYIGPRYGEDKALFLQSIDALVFPTRYVNEAEPLTLHEAMQNHLPVIAYGRGAVPEIVTAESGLVVHPDAPFVPEALARLKEWIGDPAGYRAASCAARARFIAILDRNLQQWRCLAGEIAGETD